MHNPLQHVRNIHRDPKFMANIPFERRVAEVIGLAGGPPSGRCYIVGQWVRYVCIGMERGNSSTTVLE
jgi:hypothetical protein